MRRAGRKRAKARLPPPYGRVAETVAAIELEMKRIGLWQRDPLPPEAFAVADAFGAQTMTYAQWLQFVLVPRTPEIIAARGEFTDRGGFATMGVRNFDGMEEAEPLIALLGELDRLVQH
jgi:uncharacterized protein YqcC (DUF446 family)